MSTVLDETLSIPVKEYNSILKLIGAADRLCDAIHPTVGACFPEVIDPHRETLKAFKAYRMQVIDNQKYGVSDRD